MANVIRNDVVLHGRLAGLLDKEHPAPTKSKLFRLWPNMPPQNTWRSLHSVYVLSYMADLSDHLKEVRRPISGQKRYVLIQDATPIESMAELIGGLDIRTPSRLHVARLEFDTERQFVERFIASLRAQDDEGSIMDAWCDDDELVVISPSMERIRVPIKSLHALCGTDHADWKKFEIDPMGAFIYWPSVDMHVGWSQFKQIVDPIALLRARQRSDAFNQRYGQAVRLFREEQGIKQSEIAGLDGRTVRRIEKGETRATSKALECLAKAHGLSTTAYMNELAKRLSSISKD